MAKFVTPLLILALVGFVASRQEPLSQTWQPFLDACLGSAQGTIARCECLTDYVHGTLTDEELRVMMTAQSSERSLDSHMAAVVEIGAKRCF